MKAQQTEAAATVSPSYGYLGQTLNVYLYFTALEYTEAPTIGALTIYPYGVVGAAGLTVNSSEVISSDPLIVLASVTVPSTVLEAAYDVNITLDDVDYVIPNSFSVYASPYYPAETQSTITAIMPVMMLMMVMVMMTGMMKGMSTS